MNLIKFENTELKVQYINNEIQMTIDELAKALEFTTEAIRMMLIRNPDLDSPEFTEIREVNSVENGVIKKRQKRIFTEQGIYEVTLLARTKRAAEFRRFVRSILTKLRKNQLIVPNQITGGAEKKLDEIANMVGARDEQLQSLLEYLSNVRDQIAKIEVLEKNQLLIINKIDDVTDTVNQLIDHVYDDEEE